MTMYGSLTAAVYFETELKDMRLRPILLCALCSAALLCGCEEEAQSSSVPEEKPPAQTASSPAAPVEVRNYSFPGFMKDSAVTDMLAKEDSRSFDSKTADKQVDVSPFEKYDCDRCFAEIYYSFKDKGKVGIIICASLIMPSCFNNLGSPGNSEYFALVTVTSERKGSIPVI